MRLTMLTPMSVRSAVAILVSAWVVGGCLLLVAWRSGVEDHRRHTAPECAQSQVFTRTACRAEADGTIASLTAQRAEVDVDGHHLVLDPVISHGVPTAAVGDAVRVTLYRGALTHIEGDGLAIDTTAASADQRLIFGILGGFCLFAGALNFLIALSVRRHHT